MAMRKISQTVTKIDRRQKPVEADLIVRVKSDPIERDGTEFTELSSELLKIIKKEASNFALKYRYVRYDICELMYESP